MSEERCPICGDKLVKGPSCSGCSRCEGKLSCESCGWRDMAGRHGAITDGLIRVYNHIRTWFSGTEKPADATEASMKEKAVEDSRIIGEVQREEKV